jgi:salicylate hydroxylase
MSLAVGADAFQVQPGSRPRVSSARTPRLSPAAPTMAVAAESGDGGPVADVGVIGAGPAGLTLCHALRDAGYDVQLFERRDSFRKVGAAIFMHPFALNSLRAISPELEQRLLAVCTPIHTLSFTTLSPDAPTFRLATLGDAPRVLGAPFVAVRFWDMLQALRLGLPEGCLRFGHQLERFEQQADGVTLHFAHGMPSCRVKYLIDAGGIRSRTREQLLGDARIPRLRATFSLLPSDRLELREGPGSPGELAFVAGEDMSVITMAGEDWTMWSQTDFRDDPLAPIAETEEELRAKLDAYSGWQENVQAMVAATRLDDVIESTVAELPVSWKWGEGNVTLLGDAAHAQLPALGLGVSTAMGDIEELVKQVQRHGLSQKALRWYERNRMPACAALQLMSRGMYLLSKISAK